MSKKTKKKKQQKKDHNHESTLAKLVFMTAILNLIQALVDLIRQFK